MENAIRFLNRLQPMQPALIAELRQLLRFTGKRKNMRNKLMGIFDKIMLRKRSIIECVMDSLKNICNAEHSRHRSIYGFLINTFAAIGAYHCYEKETISIQPVRV